MSLRSPCLRRTSIAPATWRPASAARSTTPLWGCARRSTSRSASGSPHGPRARIGRPSTRRPILTCTRTSGDARLCAPGGKRTSRRRTGFWAAARAGGESAERSNSSPFMGRWPEGPEGLQSGAAPSPSFAGYFPMNGEGLLDQGQLARLDDRFQLRVHAQLATEAADVRAHGRVADPQLVGDLAARRAFRHEPQDFLLARGQTLELGLDLAPGIQQLCDGPRREQRPAIGDGPDGVDDVLRRPRLVDESACPGLQGGETRGVAVLPGEEDELCLRPQLANSSRCVRAGPVGQPEVDQDEVRLELRGACDRVRHGARMPNDRHVLLVVDQRGQAFGDHLVVFHDEDPRRVALHRHIYTLDSVSGSQNSTDVPSPGSLVILFQPPASSARSFSARSPRWAGGRTSNRRRRSASSVWFSSDCASLRRAAESPLGSRRRWSCSSTAVSFCSASSCRSPANRLRALSTAVETFLSSISRAASTFSSRSAVRFKSRSAYFSCQTSPAASPAFCKTHVSSRENPSTRRESYAATWPRRWSPARQGTATAFLTPSVSSTYRKSLESSVRAALNIRS